MPGIEMLGGQHRNAAHGGKKKSEVMLGGERKRFSGVCRKDWRRALMFKADKIILLPEI